MPMSQVKGQLRESALRLAEHGAGGWTVEYVLELFGGEGPHSAALAFRGEASLPEADRQWFGAAENHAARAQLFRRMAATRIGAHGAAEDDTLRAVEVVVPVTLTGRVHWHAPRAPEIDWFTLLDDTCAVTLAFGKLKADGYGRASAQCRGHP